MLKPSIHCSFPPLVGKIFPNLSPISSTFCSFHVTLGISEFLVSSTNFCRTTDLPLQSNSGVPPHRLKTTCAVWMHEWPTLKYVLPLQWPGWQLTKLSSIRIIFGAYNSTSTSRSPTKRRKARIMPHTIKQWQRAALPVYHGKEKTCLWKFPMNAVSFAAPVTLNRTCVPKAMVMAPKFQWYVKPIPKHEQILLVRCAIPSRKRDRKIAISRRLGPLRVTWNCAGLSTLLKRVSEADCFPFRFRVALENLCYWNPLQCYLCARVYECEKKMCESREWPTFIAI